MNKINMVTRTIDQSQQGLGQHRQQFERHLGSLLDLYENRIAGLTRICERQEAEIESLRKQIEERGAVSPVSEGSGSG
jgi:hypothetical protein